MSSPAGAQAPPLTEPTVPLQVPPSRVRSRLVGVDVARGLAVIGMIATHSLPLATEAGSPTLVTMVAAGRAAATFVFLAGVSVAFLSGGPRGVQGRERVAASAGLLVRAVLVLVFGLALGLVAPQNGIWGILPFYGLMFLLALPLLGLRFRGLVWVTATVFAVGPLLLVATAGSNLPYAGGDDPTFSTLVNDPLGVLVQLLMSGAYPVVVYLGYLAAGLAIGRLDLSSRRVAWWLLGGGLALAAGARAVSWLVLYPLGGLARLVQSNAGPEDPTQMATQLLWEENQTLSTWWHLALPAPHSHTPIDLLHTLGSAAAVLGTALLLTRVPAVRRLLSPLAAVGSLALTLYCAHLLLLATGLLSEQPVLLFGAMLVGALALAVAWRRWIGQGPLEKLVSLSASATRRAVAARRPRVGSESLPIPAASSGSRAGLRRAAEILAVAAIVAGLGLGVWGRTQMIVPTADSAPSSQSEPESSDDVSGTGPDSGEASAPVPLTVENTARYCALSARYAALNETDDDPTRVAGEEAVATLKEMQRVAPADIEDAASILAEEARAEAGAVDAAAPDGMALESAQTRIDAFHALRCQ